MYVVQGHMRSLNELLYISLMYVIVLDGKGLTAWVYSTVSYELVCPDQLYTEASDVILQIIWFSITACIDQCLLSDYTLPPWMENCMFEFSFLSIFALVSVHFLSLN